MWNNLKQFFNREDCTLEDPYPDLTMKIMDLLGKDLSFLSNQMNTTSELVVS